MTDNTQFKKDGTELLDMLISFRRRYLNYNSKVRETNAAKFESDLRLMLMVARTDEENDKQRTEDLYC